MFSQESRGFGFVEMPSQAEAQKAIEGLNTKDVKGKKLIVNEARPKRDDRGGGSRGGGGGRGHGGRGGGGRR
jgi:RNA recognition motif-containing protein